MPTNGSLSKTALAKEVSGERQQVIMEGESDSGNESAFSPLTHMQ